MTVSDGSAVPDIVDRVVECGAAPSPSRNNKRDEVPDIVEEHDAGASSLDISRDNKKESAHAQHDAVAAAPDEPPAHGGGSDTYDTGVGPATVEAASPSRNNKRGAVPAIAVAPPSRNHKEGQASEVSQPGSGDATEVSQPGSGDATEVSQLGSYAADIGAANSDVSRKNKQGGHVSEVPQLDSHAVDVGAAKTRPETRRETRRETRLEAVRLSSSMQFVGEEGLALEQGEQAEEARRREQQAQAQKLREERQREQKLREEAAGVGASLPPAASGARPCVCMSACL